MSVTPTPETDAETMDGIDYYGEPLKSWDYKPSKDGEVVPAECARKLERERDESRRELQVVLDLMAVRRMNNGALVYELREHILSLERKLNEAKQMVDQLKLERMREEVTVQQDPEAQVCVYCGDALKKIKQEESK